MRGRFLFAGTEIVRLCDASRQGFCEAKFPASKKRWLRNEASQPDDFRPG